MTPNEVYERTRMGLTGLLPGRAARRMLDDALVGRQRTPEDVSADEMAEVLLGTIYQDLSEVLPRAGLRRELERLVRDLDTLDGAAVFEPGAATAATEPGAASVASESSTAGSHPTGHAPAGVADRAVRREPGLASVSLPSDPGRVLAALAVLDGVDGVAVFDARGGVVSVRGDVSEAEALGRVIAAGGRLLQRHGDLRTICVTTSAGVIVTVPVPPRWLAVTGAPDLNLGAIYAALAALEEER
jgi:hypothetical protein